MIEITNLMVEGFEPAIRGMRNSWDSWDKSDSLICNAGIIGNCPRIFRGTESCIPCNDKRLGCYCIGKNDLSLMKKLIKAGTDYRKFLRMITVWCDITAPLYWWAEFDTYKVGTVANSCSTMHCIADKEFTIDDFSCEHLMTYIEKAGTELLDVDGVKTNIFVTPRSLLNITIGYLNNCRKKNILKQTIRNGGGR